MKEGGVGGEKTTTGLRFERAVDFLALIRRVPGYTTRRSAIAGTDVVFDGKRVAQCFKKNEFYKFLDHLGVRWQDYLSRKLLPDDALHVIMRETLFIIEVKYQSTEGSVDEKLQTCDFKRKQYVKLVSSLGLKVEYVYVFNDWFRHPRYKDVLDYVHSVNCHYKFNELPLSWLGLPEKGGSHGRWRDTFRRNSRKTKNDES